MRQYQEHPADRSSLIPGGMMLSPQPGGSGSGANPPGGQNPPGGGRQPQPPGGGGTQKTPGGKETHRPGEGHPGAAPEHIPPGGRQNIGREQEFDDDEADVDEGLDIGGSPNEGAGDEMGAGTSSFEDALTGEKNIGRETDTGSRESEEHTKKSGKNKNVGDTGGRGEQTQTPQKKGSDADRKKGRTGPL